jgi:hypothetical protein
MLLQGAHDSPWFFASIVLTTLSIVFTEDYKTLQDLRFLH